ncbi:VOC family protein [Nocardia sp. NPDC052112]|uniref:VOC family protein n=1 Tax=Nocardia sp. NPDC052112 TaxID=3155646 RepID=UPI0034251C38
MMPEGKVGSLRTVVLDCPDPRRLAGFYARPLGAEPTDTPDDTWVVIEEPGGRRLAFQRAPRYRPPRFPDPEASQQMHFDVLVDKIEAAEPKALPLGAQLVQADDDKQFRVNTDPVGHTFCLIWLS